MERIILGFDGAPASRAALRWVAARAARTPVRVDVVTVAPGPSKDGGARLDQLAEAEALLRAGADGIVVELHRLEGAVSESLTSFAEHADLLVVGINVGRPVRAALAGALPLTLGAHTRVPVVTVPAGWVDVPAPITVGVASDASSEAALAFAVREAGDTGSPMRLVHAWLMPAPTYGAVAPFVSDPDTVMSTGRDTLATAVGWVRHRDATLDLRSELVRDRGADALLGYADDSSLIAIGTHHRGIIAGGLLGSVAQELLWKAPCPVAVVPRETGTRRYEQGRQE